MNRINVTSPVALSESELKNLKSALKLAASDQVEVTIDPKVIAGLSVSVNGYTVDLTAKRKLSEIAREN